MYMKQLNNQLFIDEVIPGEKSYFIVMNDKTLYKLTITKAWLEKQKYLKEQAKNN